MTTKTEKFIHCMVNSNYPLSDRDLANECLDYALGHIPRDNTWASRLENILIEVCMLKLREFDDVVKIVNRRLLIEHGIS